MNLSLLLIVAIFIIVCFSSLSGFFGYACMSKIDWYFIVPAAAASFLGGQAGARIMATRMEGKNIRIMFSILLFALCAKLLHQVFFS